MATEEVTQIRNIYLLVRLRLLAYSTNMQIVVHSKKICIIFWSGIFYKIFSFTCSLFFIEDICFSKINVLYYYYYYYYYYFILGNLYEYDGKFGLKIFLCKYICSQIMGRTEQHKLIAAQILYPCVQCADIFFLKVLSFVLLSSLCNFCPYHFMSSLPYLRCGCLLDRSMASLEHIACDNSL